MSCMLLVQLDPSSWKPKVTKVMRKGIVYFTFKSNTCIGFD